MVQRLRGGGKAGVEAAAEAYKSAGLSRAQSLWQQTLWVLGEAHWVGAGGRERAGTGDS